ELVVLSETRRVIQQVADGDGPGIIGKLWAKLRQSIIQLQLVAFQQDHNTHRSELLGDGCQKKLRFGRDGRACIQISQSYSLAVLDPPVVDQHYSHPWGILPVPLGKQGVDASVQRLRLCGGGKK